jgi:hypothetical protein
LGAVEVEIRAARGEPVAELVTDLERIAVSFDDPQYRGQTQYCSWMAMLAAGRYAEVVEEGKAALIRGGQGAIDGVPPVVSRAALRSGDAAAIRQMQAAFDGARNGRVTAAHRAAIGGALAALDGRRADARAQYMEALRLFREMNLSWVVAYTGLDAIVADALEPAERQRVADETRAIFERLSAKPYLAQLDAALAEASAAGDRPRIRAVAASDEVRSA